MKPVKPKGLVKPDVPSVQTDRKPSEGAVSVYQTGRE